MPASTLDPVNAALRASLTKSNSENILESQIAGSTKNALLANIEFESAGSYHSTVLDSLKSRYIVLKGAETAKASSKPEVDMGAKENLKLPKYELYPIESVQLGWSKCNEWSSGCGMINMGNTCYLNSTLQALFHVPALVNWLMSDKEHSSGCFESGGLCIICSMRKTLVESQNSSLNAIRPLYIYNKLRFICRNFILGRQEDAHEFLRHLVEAMEKAYLIRFKNHDQLDSKVKETTPLNQIFGGYLRSAVHCLECGHVSTTFQHFQDLLLDIRKSQTLEEALDGYFSREKLDDESYQCESCRKKVSATKQFSVERAPMVLCVQLKRFSVINTKITKHISFRQRLDLTKFTRSRPSTPLVYKLVSLVTHMGPTVNCGHYTAVGLAPSGNFYQFDDSTVRPISYQGVFTTNAYILMYELESPPFSQRNSLNVLQKSQVSKAQYLTEPSCSKPKTALNGVGFTSSKVYGPDLPPNRLSRTNESASTTVSNSNGKDSSTSNSDSDNEKEQTKCEETIGQSNSTITKSPITSEQSVDHSTKPKSRIIPFSPPFENSVTSKANSSIGSGKSTSLTKLVPYEADDSSNSEDSNSLTNANNEHTTSDALNGVWNVSSTSDKSYELSSAGKSWSKNKSQCDKTVNELFKMSHSGYSAPVSTWNGTRACLDKEVANERREDRKRTLSDQADPEDQGRMKHVKNNHSHYKSNPGYNPIEEYHHRTKNWNRNNGPRYCKQYYNNPGNRARRNFPHRHYNKGFRYRQQTL